MPVVPVVPSFATGIIPTTKLTALAAAVSWLQSPPIARMRQIVAQTLTTGVLTAVTFTAEDFDDDIDGIGGHDNTINTSRWTCRYPGKYAILGGISWATNATGIRLLQGSINGAVVNGSDSLVTPVTGNTTRQSIRPFTAQLAIGDYVEIAATQTSGGNLALNSTDQCSMDVYWISR